MIKLKTIYTKSYFVFDCQTFKSIIKHIPATINSTDNIETIVMPNEEYFTLPKTDVLTCK